MRIEPLALVFFVACNAGPADPPAACRALAHAYCHRIWDLASQGCADAIGVSASFSDEKQCEAGFLFGGKTCDQASCNPLGYSASHASNCVGATGSMQCTPDIARERIECPSICCEEPGASVGTADECCSGSAHVVAGFNCGTYSVPASTVCD
jgi:hypothetical protein